MIRSVVFGGMRAFLVAPIPFLLTPLIIRKVGARGYGTWAVFVTMNSLTSLADLGLLGTLSKYVAEYHVDRNLPRLHRLLNTGLVLFGVLASLIVALLWFASRVVVQTLFRGSALSEGDLLHLFHCALFLMWINIMTFLFSSVTSGLQRLDLTNIVTTLNIVLGAVGGAALLLIGWGVRGLLYANIVSAVVTLLIYSWLLHYLMPEFVLNPFHACVDEAKRIFGFSLQIYLTQAAVAIHNQIEKLFLALFVGVVPVGWYDIASDFALKVRSVPGLILAPVLPAASELDARRELDKLVELYYRAHKYLAFIGVPVVVFVVAVSTGFVELWIGSGLKMVALPICILLCVNFLNLMTGPGYLILAGQGFLRPGVYSALLGVGLNVPLSSVLIYFFGFSGALIGTSISLVVASVFFLYLFHRHTKNSIARLVQEAYLKPVACSLFLLVALLIFRHVAALSWLRLFVQGFLFGGCYLMALMSIRFFDDYDLNKLESVLPIARFARRFVSVA